MGRQPHPRCMERGGATDPTAQNLGDQEIQKILKDACKKKHKKNNSKKKKTELKSGL